jgi:hypothetical protein
MKKRDTGIHISRLAREASGHALAEMLAVKHFNFLGDIQTPLGPWCWRSETYAWLTAHKLVRAEVIPGWGRGWKRPHITELGELVLLAAAETALLATGRITEPEDEFEDAA